MRKYLLADIVKAVESDAERELKRLIEKYNLTEDESKYLEDTWEWKMWEPVIKASKNLSLSILNITEEEIEISRIMDDLDVKENEARYLYENFRTDPERLDVIRTADKLDTDIENIGDDDVENVLYGAGNKKESESSIGNIQWVYDRELKAYIVYIALTNNSNPKLEPTDVLYRIEPDLMKEWSESSSMGEFYNINIRSNKSLEDPAISCGCGPNPCEQGQIDQFNTKYNNLP